jgi:hypothetical protein
MLNKKSRDVLKALIPINNQMIISPEMTGADEFKSIVFKVNLKSIDPDIEEFGIFDANGFLSAVDLLEDPVISFDSEHNIIRAQDESASMEFITSLVSSLSDVDIPVSNIDTTLGAPSVLVFKVDTDLLAKIKKAMGVFRTFDTLYITKQNSNVELNLGTFNSFSKNNNSFGIKVPSTVATGDDFEIALPVDSLLKLPSMEYTCKVKHNAKKNAYRVVFENELITLVLSLKK